MTTSSAGNAGAPHGALTRLLTAIIIGTLMVGGCATRRTVDTAVPIAGLHREPSTSYHVWRVDPTDEMVADLIGSATLSACREALSDYSCSVAVGTCMRLVVFPDRNVLYLDQCEASEEEMLLKPKSAGAPVKALPVVRRE